MNFANRSEGGRKLAARLKNCKDQQPVISLCRVAVFPLQRKSRPHSTRHLVLVRKIGVPSQPELAMGAVVDGGSPLSFAMKTISTMIFVIDSPARFARSRSSRAKQLTE